MITGGDSSFNWFNDVNYTTDTHTETDTDSASEFDSGTDVDSGDSESYSDGETDTDAETSTETEVDYGNGSVDLGSEAMGSYGLVGGGTESVFLNDAPVVIRHRARHGRRYGNVGRDRHQRRGRRHGDRPAQLGRDRPGTSTVIEDDASQDDPIGTRTLGAGGMIVGYSLVDNPTAENSITTTETDIAQDSGTEFDLLPGETDTDSFSNSESDVVRTTETDFDVGASETDQGSTSIGAGGSVLGGYEATSLTDTYTFDIGHHDRDRHRDQPGLLDRVVERGRRHGVGPA